MKSIKGAILRLFFSKKDLLTILSCLECKEHNVLQNRLDVRVPMDENNNSTMNVVELLENIKFIRDVIKDQM